MGYVRRSRHNHDTHQNQREDVFYKSSSNEMQPIWKGDGKETFSSMQRSQQLQKISLHTYFKAFWGRHSKKLSHTLASKYRKWEIRLAAIVIKQVSEIMGWNWKRAHNVAPLCRGPTNAALNQPESSLLLVPADVPTSGWKVIDLETTAMTHSRVNRKSRARRFGASTERFSALSKRGDSQKTSPWKLPYVSKKLFLDLLTSLTIKTRIISVNIAPERSTADDVRVDHV